MSFIAPSILVVVLIALTANAAPSEKFEDLLNCVSPSASDEATRRYMPLMNDMEDGLFYLGVVLLVFLVTFLLLICLGCGYIDCGISSRGRTSYEEI